MIKKPTTISDWPFPIFGKISKETKDNILPKPNVTKILASINKTKRQKKFLNGVEDAIF